MTCVDINKMLLNAIPEVGNAFYAFANTQDGLNTGCHMVFEKVLLPFTMEALDKGYTNVLKRIFYLIEDMANSDDEYIEEIATLSFIGMLKPSYDNSDELIPYMEDRTYYLYDTLTL